MTYIQKWKWLTILWCHFMFLLLIRYKYRIEELYSRRRRLKFADSETHRYSPNLGFLATFNKELHNCSTFKYSLQGARNLAYLLKISAFLIWLTIFWVLLHVFVWLPYYNIPLEPPCLYMCLRTYIYSILCRGF